MFRLLAESLNINIHLVSGDKLGGANGQYMSEGELYLNASKFDTDRAMEYIFAHELTHHIKVYAPEEYRKLENLVRSRWKSRDLKVAKDGKADDGLSSMESAIHNKQMQYKNAVGQELSAEDALEEIIADSTYEMLNDADFAQMVAEREPSLGQAMVNAIKQMIANIRDVLARGLGFAPKQNEALLSQLDILKEAEMLWLDAVSAAKMNSAAVGRVSGSAKYSPVDVDFENSFDEWFDRTTPEQRKKEGGYIKLGTTSAVLQGIGVPECTVRMGKAKIQKVLEDHPEMTPKIIKGIPNMLEDPMLIVQSLSVKNSIVAYGELYDEDGKPIMVSVKIDSKNRAASIGNIAIVTSAYARSNNQYIIDNSKILYVNANKKITDAWFSSLRLQLPSDVSTYGYIDNITYIDDDVNPTGATNMAEAFAKARTRLSLPESEIQERDEHIRVLEQDAEESYGEPYTEDFNETGYILSNAKLLKMGDYGERAEDHNVIMQLYDDISYATSQSPKADAMSRFLNEGHIRIMPEANSLEFGTRVEPTYQQYDQIWAYADSYGVDTIEFTDPDGKTVAYREYDSNPGGRRLYDDIKAFYRNGSLPTARFSVNELAAEEPTTSVEGNTIKYSIWSETVPHAIGTYGKDMENIGERVFSDLERKEFTVRELRNKWMSQNGVEHVKALDSVMDRLASYLDRSAKKYRYIGLADTKDAKLSYRTDKDGNPTSVVLSAMVKNAEYPVNFDFTAVCKKRVAFQRVMNDIVKANSNGESVYDQVDLSPDNIYKINQLLEENGFETACPICFVEARRYENQAYVQKIVDTWNDTVKAKNPNAEYLEASNLSSETLAEIQADIDAAFVKYDEDVKEAKDNANARMKELGISSKKKAKMKEQIDKGKADAETIALFAEIEGASWPVRIDILTKNPVFQKLLKPEDLITEEGTRGLKSIVGNVPTYNKSGKQNGTEQKKLFGLLKQSRGASAPKEVTAFTAYNGEISMLMERKGAEKLREYLESIGGARMQSFSDFQIENVYDYIQLIGDLAAGKLPAHAYTKELAFAELFGMSGIKINLSAVCDIDPSVDGEYAGLKKVGDSYEYNFGTQSIDYDKAVELQNRDGYTSNLGIIMVGMSDQHMWKMLDDDNVRYIIPYHKSGLPIPVQDATNINMATDYTDVQNTMKVTSFTVDGEKVDFKSWAAEEYKKSKNWENVLKKMNDGIANGSIKVEHSTFKGGTGTFDVYDDLAKTNDARKTANNYVADCLKNGRLPLFYKFATHKNYYKMSLFDFNVVDNKTGKVAKQEAVKNIYPGLNVAEGETDTNAFEAVIDKYMQEQNDINEAQEPKYQDVIGEISKQLGLVDQQVQGEDPAFSGDVRFSIADKDSDGNQLSQGQREFFKDSKATDGQGNLLKLYHGTGSGGFTEFNLDGDRVIWMTSNINAANAYGGTREKFDPDEYQRKASETYSVDKKYRLNDYMVFDSEEELEKFKDENQTALYFQDTHEDYDSLSDEEYEMLEAVGVTDEDEYDQYINEDLYDNLLSAYRKYESGVVRRVPVIDLINNPDKYDVSDYLRVIMDREDVFVWEDLTDDYQLDDPNAKYELIDYMKNLAEEEGESVEEFWDYSAPVRVPEGMTVSALRPSDKNLRYELYANLLNPYIVEFHGDRYNERYYSEINYAREHKDQYDGVIVRNVEVGPMGVGTGDVVIAFNADQVKLTDNLDPTNNPDIRFSLRINDEYLDLNEDEIENRPPADKRILESLGRREETKREIISRTQNLYKSTRYTKGESIDPKSVERQIRELVMETMANSETKKKYKQKLVKQALDASKLIYKKAKQDDFEAVANIAYDTAFEIVENLDIVDDTLWNQYRELREYVRKTPIALTEEDKSEIPDYADWRKSNFGRIKIAAKGLPIDMFYQELSDQWPEMFSAEATNPADQAMRISEVLDELKPYEIAYNSEEADALTREIAGDLTNITFMGKEWQSYADKAKERYDNKTKALKMRHKEAIRDLRTGYEKKMADKDLAERMASGREMAAVKRKGEERISGIKAANKITIDNLRASRDAQIRNLKQNYKRKEEAKKNARERAKSFGRIKANYDWLTTRLLKPTDDKHIPYGFEVALADVLRQLDLQTERSKSLEEKYGVKAKNTLKLEALRVQLEEISKEDGSGIFEYDGYVFDLLKALENRINGKSVDSLTDVELRYIDTLLKSIRHSIANINKAFAEGINENISQLADKTIAEAETRKARTEYGGAKGMIDQLLNESTVTPRDFFELMGGGLNDVYLDGLRAGMDRHIEHIAYLRGVFDEIFSPYNKKNRRGKNNQPGSEIEKWRDSTNLQEFTLESGQVVSMSPAQIMSLYCLMKRQQAVGHIRGNGITLTNISTVDRSGTKFKQLVNAAKSKFGQPLQKNGTAQRVSDADLQNIVSALTPEQMQMADRLQKIVSEDCSKWGNETSLQMYGYEKFTEANYFPITSSRTYLASDYSKRETVESIKNFGFTKGIVVGANNPIVIDDIFTVVADHCNKMSLYNAFAAPIADFTRVMNYKVQGEDGLTAKALKAVIQDTYGSKAVTYINNFLADIQTQQQTRHDGMLSMLTKSLANYKKATIGANLRVALQQPTAVVRSFLLIDPKYFRPIKIKDEMQDMIKHCPIAAWKSWGHNQVDMARDIDAIMMNQEWTRLDAVTMEIYGALDNVTWAHIWAAVKNEVKAKNPNVSVGSEEFYELCNKRASEVFDKTQVVDSVFHRSQGMRSTEIAAKMMTSFMAEPTRTYNMMRTAFAQARAMAQAGDKKEAGKLAGKATTVFIANAMVCGAAAAVADAIRDQFTGDDDDKDYESFFEAWYKSTIENFKDNANPLGMIPFVKDIWQLQDWDSSNMAYEGWESLMHSIKTLEEVMTGKSKSTPEKAIWEFVKSIGLITGVPIKNGARELEGLANLFGITWRPLAAEKSVDLSSYDASADSEMRIKDGSWIDNLMNKFGAHLTSEEQMQKDVSVKAKEIQKKCEGTSGREYDKKLYNAAKNAFNDNVYEDGSKVTFASAIEHGDYKTIELMRQVLAEAGGDVSQFDEDVLKKTKSVFKANIGLEDNQAYMQMSAAKEYLIGQGWTQQDISSQLVAGTNGGTKCQTAKDFQVAFCENNQELTEQKLIDLCSAGLTFKDYVELVDNASRSVKAENYSTGSYDWPFDGQAQITKGYSRSNANVEIAMPVGTNVKAADGGKVTFVGDYGKYGQQVVIDHGNGRKSIYSHLDTFKVYKGQIVSKGDVIALSGNTGVTNGPSLGLKMYEGGSTIDPTTYL